jgi:tetratricopeptide (TPR) repeat protein
MLPAERTALALLLLTAAAGPLFAQTGHAGHTPPPAAPAGPDAVRLYDNLGTLSRTITTASPDAQAFFDQGLRLTYGFGHDEAVASFREAARHDPDCAMCHWGVAWALGPYINARMDSTSGVDAFRAIREAQRLARRRGGATDAERALIEAMATRYAAAPTQANRAALDSAYANAMRDVVRRFPDDLDAATLFAEALMVLRPWNQWTREGRPQPGTEEVLATLEGILARDIRHPGACHLYIHAVEASPDPKRAEPCAELLGDAIPGASHIPHMPSHIWMRIGRYGDAVRANQRAWHADQQASLGRAVRIYPTHNLHMLLFAASYDGQSAVAAQAARDLARIAPGNRFYVWLVQARFGRWQEILEDTALPDAAFLRGLWHFARGTAHHWSGAPDSARAQLAALDTVRAELDDSARFRGHRQHDLLGIARGSLAAEIEAGAGRFDQAVRILREAVPLEDDLRYDEPEPWLVPVRQVLGAVLLDAGRPAEAEAAFREELVRHPDNGWSLWGLEQALRGQGRAAEADDVRRRFEQAWVRADVWLRSPRF